MRCGLKRLMESQPPLDNWISCGNTDITIKRTCTNSPPLKKTTNYHKKDDSINMDSTIVWSMNDNINMDGTIVWSMNDRS